MLNDLNHFCLVIDMIDRLQHVAGEAAHCQDTQDARLRARAYARQHWEDDPQIAGWRWSLMSEVARQS